MKPPTQTKVLLSPQEQAQFHQIQRYYRLNVEETVDRILKNEWDRIQRHR